MLAILGTINTIIGYINMNVKIKNRVYTLVAFFGNFYMLYVAYRFFANGYPGRGVLYLLAFIMLAYWLYLNILYWYTKEKTSRWDISPKIERMFGIKPKDPEEEARKKVLRAGLAARQPGYVQTNGIFTDNNLLEAKLSQSSAQAAAVQAVVHELVANQVVALDFGNVSDEEIIRHGNERQFPALVAPIALPYFELINRNGRYLVVGGVNQFERKELGEITSVGLLPISAAANKYRLALATVVVVGGPYKYAQANQAKLENKPFSLKIQMAYQQRQTTPNVANNQSSFQPNQSQVPGDEATQPNHFASKLGARSAHMQALREQEEKRQQEKIARLRRQNGDSAMANHQWNAGRTQSTDAGEEMLKSEGLSRVQRYHKNNNQDN